MNAMTRSRTGAALRRDGRWQAVAMQQTSEP